MSRISLRRIRRERKRVKTLNKAIDFLFDVAWGRNQREKLKPFVGITCDTSNNTREDIELGILNVNVQLPRAVDPIVVNLD